MDTSDDNCAELNTNFNELLIESNEERPFANDEATVQSLIILVESNSSEEDDNGE